MMNLSSLSGTRKVAPVAAAEACATSLPDSTGSILRTVTGSKPSPFASMMPNGAGNFSSGGCSPVRTVMGKRAWLSKARPASSVSFGGRLKTKLDCTGKGPSKAALYRNSAFSSSFEIVGAYVLPPPFRVMARTCAALTGAENCTRMGRKGMHCSLGLLRSQLNLAVKSGRVLNCRVCALSVAIPLALAMPSPHTSETLALAGKLRLHCSTVTGSGGAPLLATGMPTFQSVPRFLK